MLVVLLTCTVNLESSSGACVSPGKAVELQMENFEQL